MADDNDDKPRLTYTIGVALTDPEGEQIASMGRALDRSAAYVARQLIREALAARAKLQEAA